MRLLRIEIDTDVSVWSEKGELVPADLRTDVGDALSATTLKLVLAELGEKIESGQHKGKIHAKSGELMGFWDWTREEDSGFGESAAS